MVIKFGALVAKFGSEQKLAQNSIGRNFIEAIKLMASSKGWDTIGRNGKAANSILGEIGVCTLLCSR